ncbi:hypothetical protein GWK82_00455 [Yersinia pestis]|nr:hypothetical protein [Yersinia pestis]
MKKEFVKKQSIGVDIYLANQLTSTQVRETSGDAPINRASPLN